MPRFQHEWRKTGGPTGTIEAPIDQADGDEMPTIVFPNRTRQRLDPQLRNLRTWPIRLIALESERAHKLEACGYGFWRCSRTTSQSTSTPRPGRSLSVTSGPRMSIGVFAMRTS